MPSQRPLATPPSPPASFALPQQHSPQTPPPALASTLQHTSSQPTPVDGTPPPPPTPVALRGWRREAVRQLRLAHVSVSAVMF